MYVTIVLFASLFFQGATISWDRVTQNSDGTPTTDLAGYRIHWGIESGNYNESIDVGNETYWEFNFDPGEYYFVITAYDFSDNESSFSREVVWIEKSIPVDSIYTDEVIIYPNPFYNILEINAVGTVEIFNMLGQSIKKIEINGRQYVDLSYLPVGVYFFCLQRQSNEKNETVRRWSGLFGATAPSTVVANLGMNHLKQCRHLQKTDLKFGKLILQIMIQ